MNLFQNPVPKLNNGILTRAIMAIYNFLSFDLYLLPINSSVYSVTVLVSKRCSGVKTSASFAYFHLSIFHSGGCSNYLHEFALCSIGPRAIRSELCADLTSERM
jgi:hypothetical protein